MTNAHDNMNHKFRARYAVPAFRAAGHLLMLAILVAAMAILPAHASPGQAAGIVKQTTDQVLASIASNNLQGDSVAVQKLTREIVMPHFDVRRMSAWVLGPSWKRANDAQKQAFAEAFAGVLIRTYSRALTEYNGQEVVYLPERAGQNNQSMVRTEIRQTNGSVIPVHYRMHNKDGGWKVIDVSIDGISLVTNYRNSFRREVKRQGIDGLVKQLNARGQQLAQAN